jgi:hypothetical protein
MTVPAGPPAGQTGSAPSGFSMGWNKWWGALAAGVVVMLITAATVVVVGGGSAGADEFFLEPVSTLGDNPFLEGVDTDEPDVEPPEETGGTFEAATPGLYGGTMNEDQCDADQIVAFLGDNADQAGAWADVRGIAVAEIAEYVDGLTPVVLRSDTAVTNHGYRDGAATGFPAVLQAGTAVLVDEYGSPVVKCYCGNPLTEPPSHKDATYRGTRWTHFQPTTITVVVRVTVVINIFVLVDGTTNQTFGRPAGTSGDEDGPAPDAPQDPTTTTTTTTAAPGGLPENATYSGQLSLGDCGSSPFTGTLAGDSLTLSGIGGNPDFVGSVAPDGSFTFSDLGRETLTGTVTADGMTGTAGGSCTGTITGDRTG